MKFFIIFLASLLFALDLDFDGVPDNKDYCPRSPLFAIVNNHGCEIHKKFDFNLRGELGYQYLTPQKIPSRYLRTTFFHTTYEFSYYISQININSYKTYTKLFDFSKRFYNNNGYYKLSFLYYSKTYYLHSTYGFQISSYFKNKELLIYYKFKKSRNKLKNKHTIFIEKFKKYPKIVLIPFIFFENSSFNNNIIYASGGISAIVKVKSFYIKSVISKNFNSKNTIFLISVIFNY